LTTGQTWFADTFMFQRAVNIHAPLLDRHECGLHVNDVPHWNAVSARFDDLTDL